MNKELQEFIQTQIARLQEQQELAEHQGNQIRALALGSQVNGLYLALIRGQELNLEEQGIKLP